MEEMTKGKGLMTKEELAALPLVIDKETEEKLGIIHIETKEVDGKLCVVEVNTGEIIGSVKLKPGPKREEPFLEKGHDEVPSATSMEWDDEKQTFAWGDVAGSTSYVSVRIAGPHIIGDRRLRYEVWFSGKNNSYNLDGQYVRCDFSYDGGSGEAQLDHIKARPLPSKYYVWDWTLPSGKTWANVRAVTRDRDWDSRFGAVAGYITMYQGTYDVNITERGSNYNRYQINYRNTESEEISLQKPDGGFHVINKGASGSGGTTEYYNMPMPINSAYTRQYGLVPNNTGGPYCWGSKGVAIQTSYTAIPMPTVSASRSSSDPSRVTVSWTAGGTTNKPQGDASRVPYIILRRPNNSNVAYTTSINLEVAGSYTFSNCPLDEEFDAFAEYAVYGLAGGTHYPSSNRVRIERAFTANVKVGGSYRRSSEAYVKVGGSYRRIVEAFVKVNGAYRRIT